MNQSSSLNSLAKRTLVLLFVILALMGQAAFSAKRTSFQEGSQSGQQLGVSPEQTKPGVNGKIAFASNRNGNYDIFTMRADGSQITQLTATGANDLDPSWSPDGKKLAFLSNRDGNYEIYVMNDDGTGQTRLTNTAADEFDPIWSPSGAKIAFSSDSTGNFEVYVMNADGTSPTNITNNRADDAFPTWSPDSAKLAFTSDRNGNADIWIMNADGSGQTALTTNLSNEEFPAWSPSGSKILFASDRNGSFDIFVMNVDGSAQTALTSGADEDSYPAWSPDGKKITFTRGVLNGSVLENNDVFVMNADGGGQANITNSVTDDVFPDWQSFSVTTAPFANPIDDPQFFVRQQYLDLLNREPDAGGLAYWTGQITACGTDTLCIERKRVDVAAAFFIEQEFQQTGFFVIRVYKAALGRRPTFAEFIADRNQIMAGPNLESSKQAYLNDFVQRLPFLTKYPAGLSGTQFIDALIANVKVTSGVDLSDRRTEFVNDFNANMSRARILRLAADDSRFMSAEYNKGFVLAQYFGYLRRDPDEGGFQFWLNVLNTSGNFRGMVCAFINSAEYQLRFGSVVTHSDAVCSTVAP